MAFISENWLKQEVVRNRAHSPVQVEMEVEFDESDWSSERGVLLSVYLNTVNVSGKSKQRYKGLYMTQDDCMTLAKAFSERLDEKSLADLFLTLARRLNDTTILDQVGKARRERSKRY